MKTWLPVCFSEDILQGPAKDVVTWRDEGRVGNMAVKAEKSSLTLKR